MEARPPDDEVALLGCILNAPDMLAGLQADEGMRRDWFSNARLGIIYEQAAQLYERTGTIGATDLFDALKDLDDRTALLVAITKSVTSGVNARGYAARVKRAYKTRRLREIASALVSGETEPDAAADTAMMALSDLLMDKARGVEGICEVAATKRHRIEEIRAGRIEPHGIDTGYTWLDSALGGFLEGQLVVIGSRPGVGKTTLLLNIACNIAQTWPVLFISREMHPEVLTTEMSANIAGEYHDSFKDRYVRWLQPPQLERVLSGLDSAGKLDVLFDTASRTVGHIITSTRVAVRRWKIAVMMLDYLQLVEAPDVIGKRYEKVGAMSRALKLLAGELGIPIVVACQLSREADDGEIPRLSHMRESGNIEQDADVVLLMHRTRVIDEARHHNEVALYIAKNRYGQVGKKLLLHDAPKYRFVEIVKDEGAEL